MNLVESERKLKTNKPIVLAAIVISTFMSAIEGTIVATAMPGIVSELGGFSLYSWVFSAYLIMQAVTILIYGKLADLFGRKPIFVFGVTIFLIGSLLCGLATSMVVLIMFRLIQGFGAGAVTPIATTIVGDMYTLEERGKVQGYLSSVWGISAILGPLLGGVLVQYVSWSWIFWINIPIGLFAIVGIVFFLHEEREKKQQKIDYLGSILLLIAILAFMVVLIQGGSVWGWFSIEIVSLSAIALFFFLFFLYQEHLFEEPMLPLRLWRQRAMVSPNLATLTSGMIVMGVSSFLPTFVQGVMGQTPIIAGFTLTTMSIGWPIASTIAGRMIVKVGFRLLAIVGGVSLLVGAILFVFLTPALGPIWAGAASFFIGIGMGLTSTTFIVAIQSHVNWEMRGIATANNMFMRMLGNAVGAALLGGILNSKMSHYFYKQGKSVDKLLSNDVANVLLNDAEKSTLSEETLFLLQDGLAYGLHYVYICLFVIACVTFLFIIMLPKSEKVI